MILVKANSIDYTYFLIKEEYFDDYFENYLKETDLDFLKDGLKKGWAYPASITDEGS